MTIEEIKNFIQQEHQRIVALLLGESLKIDAFAALERNIQKIKARYWQ